MINLSIKRSQFTTSLFPLLLDYSHRFEGYKGSAGSGKSYFITQKIIIRCCRERIRVLVCRKYASTLRNSVFALFKEILRKWQIEPYVDIRETDFHIQFPNGSEIIFIGLDDESKLLSLTNISTIFIEEISEVSKDVFDQLNLRMRGKAPNQQIIFAFNPISQNHWLYDYCVLNPPEDFIFSETTYKDNPFLDAAYVKTIEDLRQRNPAKFRVYGLGLWGLDPEGLVFNHWRQEQFDYKQLLSSGLELRIGCDFGFIDPSVIVCSLYNPKEKRIYIYDEWYKSGVQLDSMLEAMKQMGIQRQVVFCDSAEPRSIDFLKRQGVPAKPCIKGQDSVQARILFLQNHEIIVLPKCSNVIRELSNFSYVRSKESGKYTEKTTHEFSHSIDALGYAYSDIYTKGKLRTVDKSILGL